MIPYDASSCRPTILSWKFSFHAKSQSPSEWPQQYVVTQYRKHTIAYLNIQFKLIMMGHSFLSSATSKLVRAYFLDTHPGNHGMLSVGYVPS